MLEVATIIALYIAILLLLEYIPYVIAEYYQPVNLTEEDYDWVIEGIYKEDGMFYTALYVVFSPLLLLYIISKYYINKLKG
jgi:hypothetical protein